MDEQLSKFVCDLRCPSEHLTEQHISIHTFMHSSSATIRREAGNAS